MEFGSDFHKIKYPVGKGLPDRIFNFNYYVSGRQPLLDVIQNVGYRRVWIPSYYCGESIKILDRIAVEIKRYPCLPTDDPDSTIDNLPLLHNDLLLRVNFFGLHGYQNCKKYPCDVIEDHTHNLIGEWARKSNAQWCFASVRKTLPTADGGILWSPRDSPLPEQARRTNAVAEIMSLRYSAMEAKTDYLNGLSVNKDEFLKMYKTTEGCFEAFDLSDCSAITNNVLRSIDIEAWYDLKKSNFTKLLSLLNFRYSEPVIPKEDKSTPFSLIILFDSNQQRENARSYLIRNRVYPAILWSDVYEKDEGSIDYSKRMLSIHCDGRYSEKDMRLLAQILNTVI